MRASSSRRDERSSSIASRPPLVRRLYPSYLSARRLPGKLPLHYSHSTGQTRSPKNCQEKRAVPKAFRSARYCGQDGQVGSYHRDEIRNIVGHTTHMHVQPSGAVSAWGGALGTITASLSSAQSGTSSIGLQVQFDASKAVPTGPENVPQHYRQSVGLYLGRLAQI